MAIASLGLFKPQDHWNLRGTFGISVAALSIIFIPLFYAFVSYSDDIIYSEHVQQYYQWFLDVEIMVFLGFGCLMTFLRRYSYSAIAFNFFISCFVMLYSILIIGLFSQVVWGPQQSEILLDIPLLINCAFAAASAMIAFGAVLGKATPTQMLWLCFFMIPLYAVNQHLVEQTFEAFDIGGSVSIHAFGAYYGLAASLMLSRNQVHYTSINVKNAGSYTSDVFSMIGTLFLWIYWPSFNAALASSSNPLSLPLEQQAGQFLVCLNTVTSLLGSCVATFAVSAFVDDHFNIMHVQNASLAGGVAMGSAANLFLTPGGALTVGLAAGSISTLGFAYLTPLLERAIGLGDTCGVHNLHGIPGILGGLVAGFAALGQSGALLHHSTAGAQFGYQLAAIAVTVAIAVVGGGLAGLLVTWGNPADQKLTPAQLFDDGAYWTEVEVEALPDNWDGAGSSVHRGGARMWGDASHTLHNAGESMFDGSKKGGGSRPGHGWPREHTARGGGGPTVDLEAAAASQEREVLRP